MTEWIKMIRAKGMLMEKNRDFAFQLNEQEIDAMVSQNAIPSRKHLGGHNPYVFTEQSVHWIIEPYEKESTRFIGLLPDSIRVHGNPETALDMFRLSMMR